MKKSSFVATSFPAGTPDATRQARSYKTARAGLVSVWDAWTKFFIFATFILGIVGFINPRLVLLNYAFTALMIAGIIMSIANFGILNSNFRYLWPGIVLSLIGIISFTVSITSGEFISYGSALVPMGFTTAAIFLPPGKINIHRAIRLFSRCLIILVGVNIALNLVSGPVNHGSMIVIVIALAIASVTRQNTLLVLTIFAIAIYSLQRPSSTIVISTVVVIVFSLLHRAKFIRAYYLGILAAIFAIVAINIISMFAPETLLPILGIESYLKTVILEANTNMEFRLAVIRAASYDFSQNSLLLGKLFSGSVNASEMDFFLPWWNAYEAPIHSDFAIIIDQGGVLGITLFTGWLFGIFLMFRNGVQLATMAEAPEIKRFFEAGLLCSLVFIIFISFNPMLQELALIVPFYTLIWLGAMARMALSREGGRLA